MDLWTIHVINTSRSPLILGKVFSEKPICWNPGKFRTSLLGVEDGRVIEIRVSKRKLYSFGFSSLPPIIFRGALDLGDILYFQYQSEYLKCHANFLVIYIIANGDRPTPGDGAKGNNSFDRSDHTSQNSLRISSDWREVRALLYRGEQVEKAESDAQSKSGKPYESKPLGLKWAHPISVPETGCVLVATEKLDGVCTFGRTIVLLVRSGSRHPQEGSYGVVINRPIHKKIKHMNPTNDDLETTLSDFSLHFGGALEANMFLLRTGERSKLPSLEEVVPGLCFSSRNSLDKATMLVKKRVLKPQDFRLFVGYAGWQLDQLREEIESDYWHVAACSSNLIFGASSGSSESLWEEILQLTGDQYF